MLLKKTFICRNKTSLPAVITPYIQSCVLQCQFCYKSTSSHKHVEVQLVCVVRNGAVRTGAATGNTQDCGLFGCTVAKTTAIRNDKVTKQRAVMFP